MISGKFELFEDIVPLYLVRIANNMSVKEFADAFMVTGAYINAIEKGDKVMNRRTIKMGMIDLGSSYEDYLKLQEVCELLAECEIPEIKKYQLGLMKALSLFDDDPVEDEKLEKVLNRLKK